MTIDVNLDEMKEYRKKLEIVFDCAGTLDEDEILQQFDDAIEEIERLQKKIKHMNQTQSPRGYGIGS